MVILEFQDPEGTIGPTRITQIRHETAEKGMLLLGCQTAHNENEE